MPRKKLDHRTQLFARVDGRTVEKLKVLAKKLGYVYDEEGSIGKLLDAIALVADTDRGYAALMLLLKSD